VAHTEKRNAYRDLVWKTEGHRPLERIILNFLLKE
jgi:hypothetical protein